jgi:hypothetical protein
MRDLLCCSLFLASLVHAHAPPLHDYYALRHVCWKYDTRTVGGCNVGMHVARGLGKYW